MRIESLTAENPLWERLAAYAEACSWRAGPSLARDMRAGKFVDWERVFCAVDGDDIAGYCVLTKTDCIPDKPYTPWVGFVFVDEKHRGMRLSERLIDAASAYAGTLGFDRVYLCTDHVGLYEKYGFVKIDSAPAEWDADTIEDIFERRT